MKVLEENILKWTRENVGFLSKVLPKVTIESLINQIEVMDKEHTEASQELLQRREEVNELMERNKDIYSRLSSKIQSKNEWRELAKKAAWELVTSLADEKLAVANADRLQDVNIQLQKELDAKKVVLPKEVAIALDTLKKCGYTVSGVMHYQKNHKEADDCHDELRVIRNYVCIDGYRKDGLSYADGVTIGIVNDYTIEEPEETTDDKIISMYKRICEIKCNPEEAEVMRTMAILQGNTELIRRMDIVDGDMPF